MTFVLQILTLKQKGKIIRLLESILSKGMTHIGIVSNIFDRRAQRYLIIYNIGAGAQAEDVVFNWKITGHFRYF